MSLGTVPCCSLNALIEVSARVPDIACIAQTTLVMVKRDRNVVFYRQIRFKFNILVQGKAIYADTEFIFNVITARFNSDVNFSTPHLSRVTISAQNQFRCWRTTFNGGITGFIKQLITQLTKHNISLYNYSGDYRNSRALIG